MALIYRNGHVKDCPAHNTTKNYSAAIRGHLQSTILENLVRLSFEATCGAGGFSMGLLVRTYGEVQRHPLESFFQDLYQRWRYKNGSHKPSHGNKTQDALLRLTQRELWRAFNTGVASPNDVDKDGRTLLHVSKLYPYVSKAINN